MKSWYQTILICLLVITGSYNTNTNLNTIKMNYSSLTTKQLEKKKYSLINEANKIHQEISRRNRAQDQNKELENEIRRALKLYKLKPYIAAEHVFVNPTTEQYQKVVNISRKMKSETQEIERSKILFP